MIIKLDNGCNNGSIKHYHNDYQVTRKIVDNLSLMLADGLEREDIIRP